MTQTPTLTQLLKQAIDNRLLEVHTALIAVVESYDAVTPQVNVSPILKRRVRTLEGEWFMDESLGIPYFTEVFGHKRNVRFIRQMILPEIEAVPGVREVKDFTVQEEVDRKIFITFTPILSNGDRIQFDESVGV